MQGYLEHIIISAVLLFVFGAVTVYCVKKRIEKLTDALRNKASFIHHLIKLFLGIIFFGLVPLFALNRPVTYFKAPNPADNISLLIIVFALLIIAISKKASKDISHTLPVDYQLYGLLWVYFPLRFIFLVAYEFFFRGFFLFVLIGAWGVYVAVTINLICYTLLHAGSGRKEFLGAPLLGFVLCFVTIESGSIWPAAALHLLLALSYEIQVTEKIFHPQFKKAQ